MSQDTVLPEIMATPCKASDIIRLNQTKEYTAAATALLHQVTNDTSLTGRSSQLWQLLFNKARFDSQLVVKVSIAYLAREMNRSPRQVNRYINSLKEHGYLVTKENFKDNGNQTTNTYCVRFPIESVNTISNEKRRKVIVDTPIDKENIEEWDKLNLPPYFNQPAITTKIATILEEVGRISPAQYEEYTANSNIHSNLDDRQENPNSKGDDKSVIQYNNFSYISSNKENNSKKEIKAIEHEVTHSEPVVDDLLKIDKEKETNALLSKLPLLQQKETGLLAKINAFYRDMATLTLEKQLHLKEQIDCLYQKINKIQAKMDSIKRQVKAIKVKAITIENENKDDLVYLFPGERRVSKQDFDWLYKQLSQMKQDEGLVKLLNEVLYEARFGSLARGNQSKRLLTIRHSCNIALKLVREGRWQTPADFNEFIKKAVNY